MILPYARYVTKYEMSCCTRIVLNNGKRESVHESEVQRIDRHKDRQDDGHGG